MRKLRYKLHWASGDAPKPCLKWVIYDWVLICPVAYTESRVMGRALCAFLNGGGDSMFRSIEQKIDRRIEDLIDVCLGYIDGCFYCYACDTWGTHDVDQHRPECLVEALRGRQSGPVKGEE